MTVWALSDPHLSLGIANKKMDKFGENWEGHPDKIAAHWNKLVSPNDLVLVSGDISWAMRLEDALPDLEWLHSLPGTKVVLRGNHDYWWGSLKKMAPFIPSSIHLIQNNVFNWDGEGQRISIGGSRLWDSNEFSFGGVAAGEEEGIPADQAAEDALREEEREKIFLRELQRLELSLKALDPHAKTRIALTHYPPLGADLKPSRTSELLKKYKIDICVFGHLHGIKVGSMPFGISNDGIRYVLASCDYLNFTPLGIL